MKKGNIFILLVFLVCSVNWSQFAFAGDFKIEQVTKSIYRFVTDRYRSVFLVTEKGILITDPLNTEAATWLKKELKDRFDLPVKYVIYSHNHGDHIYGAEVFKDSQAIFVSSQLAKQDIVVTHTSTVLPDIAFKETMTIFLGDQEVELRYHGPNDGRGSISMLFKPDKVLFVVDWIVVGRMPWRKLWSYDIQGMINSTREVLNLDFDIFVGGHADIGTKTDVNNYLAFIETLYTSVIDGIHSGKTLAQLKDEIKLPQYSHLRNYKEWLPMNIEGVYERLMEESGMGWRSDID
jgi:glyoxylase-like metal-dependent hydrolase (beta-lactamase superfamily II)